MFFSLQLIASRGLSPHADWLPASEWVRHAARNLICLLALHFNQTGTSIFAPQATSSRSIFGLSMLVLSICAVIFLIVSSLLLYTLIRYRHRRGFTQREPAQIYGSTQIELSWTVIPILIVVVLFLATARVIFVTENAAKPCQRSRRRRHRPSVLVGVSLSQAGRRHRQRTAHPGQRPNAPHPDLPHHVVGGHRSQLLGSPPCRQDGRDSEPRQHDVDRSRQAGLYLGQCAQYCGTQHAKMLMRVYADSPDGLCRLDHAAAAAAAQIPGSSRRPRRLSSTTPASAATPSPAPSQAGRFGPDLTHLASRDTIASGAVPNTPHNLRALIDDPRTSSRAL